jgi:cytochrome c2
MVTKTFELALLAACLLLACSCERVRQTRFEEAARLTGGGDARAGAVAIRKYGCNGCHTITGIEGAHGMVGPPLDHFAYRVYIAGKLPNTPDNLMHWIQKPQEVVPSNAMPDMGIGEKDSRDIAAYLYSLR